MLTRACLGALTLSSAAAGALIQPQQPLRPAHNEIGEAKAHPPKLHGRFLHITDLHPDLFYKVHSATDGDNVCHHGSGQAGVLGAETTSCDSPFALLNATFDWIAENVRDSIDFVLWTGDSARHDNDDAYPRDSDQVLGLNRMCAEKFLDVFGTGNPKHPLSVPVVPTIGNNDILPHNNFYPGPNKWTRSYLDVWRELIPKAQRHAFDKGGWFWTEVIPDRLAVVSLNSLYWFTKNAAVDGCADPGEPGFQHFEWLRKQLQLLRERGLKVIIIGHVPPARTESKTWYDESCWQKYALWMHRYRDIIVGSTWGHANNDHFMLQDVNEVDFPGLNGEYDLGRSSVNGEVSIQAKEEYLNELRESWSRLPTPPKDIAIYEDDFEPNAGDGSSGESETTSLLDCFFKKLRKGKISCLFQKHRGSKTDKKNQKNAKKFFDKIGGPWAERYTLDLISPSMVPNYYPTLRVVEYNVSGLESLPRAVGPARILPDETSENPDEDEATSLDDVLHDLRKKKKKHKKKKTNFKMPKAPSKSAPPGPAHSPQTFSWLGYQQLYLNITTLNRELEEQDSPPSDSASNHKPATSKNFTFEVEYDTRSDEIFALKDLTVRSFVNLATRIGKFKPEKGDILCNKESSPCASLDRHNARLEGLEDSSDVEAEKKKEKKHKRKHKGKHGKRKIINRTWYAFVERAYVNTLDEDELHENFGQPEPDEVARYCNGMEA